MSIDEKIQQALSAPDDCGYARLAKDLARFLQETRSPSAATPAPAADNDGWILWFGMIFGSGFDRIFAEYPVDQRFTAGSVAEAKVLYRYEADKTSAGWECLRRQNLLEPLNLDVSTDTVEPA